MNTQTGGVDTFFPVPGYQAILILMSPIVQARGFESETVGSISDAR